MKTLGTVIVFVVLFGSSFGCNSNPVQSPDRSPSQATSVQHNNQLQNVQLLDVPQPIDITLSKKYYAGDWFTDEEGGTISIRAEYRTNNKFGKASINAKFTLAPNALNNNQYILMSFDNYKMQIKFNPHGLNFNIPAKLSYSATGVDLSSVPDGTVLKLYYFDEETGMFEEMKSGTITYNVQSGTISCLDGEIPHFSEYAFGYIKK